MKYLIFYFTMVQKFVFLNKRNVIGWSAMKYLIFYFTMVQKFHTSRSWSGRRWLEENQNRDGLMLKRIVIIILPNFNHYLVL